MKNTNLLVVLALAGVAVSSAAYAALGGVIGFPDIQVTGHNSGTTTGTVGNCSFFIDSDDYGHVRLPSGVACDFEPPAGFGTVQATAESCGCFDSPASPEAAEEGSNNVSVESTFEE